MAELGGSMKTGILVPVWVNYRWIAPLTKELIDREWPDHPELWFCGLERAPESGWNVIPMSEPAECTNWTRVLLDGVDGMIARGFDTLYIIPEEHVPLAKCRADDLNVALPDLMVRLDALYISLMGWDNRRFVSKSPVLSNQDFGLKHLTGPRDPRFHLHPALWNAEAARTCCKIALENKSAGGSAWHFEKATGGAGAPLPAGWETRCYQIRASVLSTHPRGWMSAAASWCERSLFHKLMALVPHLPKAWVSPYLRAIPFDDVFCDGPYPMFYSGIMAKGGPNKHFVHFLRKKNPDLLDEILSAMPDK